MPWLNGPTIAHYWWRNEDHIACGRSKRGLSFADAERRKLARCRACQAEIERVFGTREEQNERSRIARNERRRREYAERNDSSPPEAQVVSFCQSADSTLDSGGQVP